MADTTSNIPTTDDILAFQHWVNTTKSGSLKEDGVSGADTQAALVLYGLEYTNFVDNRSASELNKIIEQDEAKLKTANSSPNTKGILIGVSIGALATFLIMKFIVKKN